MDESIKLFNSVSLGGKQFPSSNILSILFNRFQSLKYSTVWAEKFQSIDARPQVFTRIESATLVFEQNITASLLLHNQFLEIGIQHGYSKQFIMDQVVRLREVTCRTAYIDAVYYALDHFYHLLSSQHKVATNGRDKQKEFSALLKNLSLDKKSINKQSVLRSMKLDLPEELREIESEFKEANSGGIPYASVHQYLTLIRNSLHNNGFSNKGMPNLSVGPFSFDNIEKNSYLQCLGISHLVFIFYCTLEMLEDICEASLREVPSVITDPYMEMFSKLFPKNPFSTNV